MHDGVLDELSVELLPLADLERELFPWRSSDDVSDEIPLLRHGDETVDVDGLEGGGYGCWREGSGEGSVGREEGRGWVASVESPGETGIGLLSLGDSSGVGVLLDEGGGGEIREDFGFEDAEEEGKGTREGGRRRKGEVEVRPEELLQTAIQGEETRSKV